MLNDFNGAKKVYIACGYTDLRRGIDGLATIVEQQFQLDPCSDALLFVLWQKNRQNQGFVLGRRWVSVALQTLGERQISMASK